MTNRTDTNRASELYELCKKVYELTGWDDLADDHPWVTEFGTPGYKRNCVAPLYTSDYLLEKLGDAELQEVSLYRCHHYDSSMNWCAIYDEQEFGGAKLYEYHDTPLLSLLKLTIALSEAGELNGKS